MFCRPGVGFPEMPVLLPRGRSTGPIRGVAPGLGLWRAAWLPLLLLSTAQRPAQAQLVWTLVDPTAPQPGGWGTPVVARPQLAPVAPLVPAPAISRVSAPPLASQPAAVASWPTASQQAPASGWRPSANPSTGWAAVPGADGMAPAGRSAAGFSPPVAAMPRTATPLAVTPRAAASPAVTSFELAATPQARGVASTVPATAPVALPPPAATPSPEEVRRLREQLRIPPIVKRATPWPSPSLSPGVPSAFVANWGDVFVGVSGATPGKQRDGVVDGSFNAGFGLGSAAKAVALEVSGGCGSIKDFCANGSFTARLGRLLVNEPNTRVSLAGAWQNFAQWGNEGRQDNVYYGAVSYAVPLQPGRPFAQTLQFNVGVGNSQYAPYVSEDSESQIGAFASLGVELTKFLGISGGWSGRGANAQLSITPFERLPITINLLGSDLFNQTPSGAVGVLSISWGANFLTPSF